MFDQLKNLSQMGGMMAKAKEMQQKMQDLQARLPTIRATGEAGGGLIRVTANGAMEVTRIEYATSAPLTDPELIGDLTRAAVNQALKNVQAMVQEEMKNVTGDIDLGPLQRMLGGGM